MSISHFCSWFLSLLLIIVFSAFLLAPAVALAQAAPSGGGGQGLQPPPNGDIATQGPFSTIEGIFEVLQAAVQWLLIFAVVIGVIFIIVGGIQYVTAGGDAEQTSKATRMIAYAAVGIAIILLAYILVNLIANIVGAEVPGQVLPQ